MTTETSREGTPKLSPEKKSVVYDYDPPYILTTLVTFYLACWHHDLYSTTTFMNEIAWCIRAFFFLFTSGINNLYSSHRGSKYFLFPINYVNFLGTSVGYSIANG
jgi:hypothetical protein